jgi:serine/threonine protein kinase
MLLGRLHHRNLVNLVGYCEERGQRILVYEFMTNGSLEQQLNDKEHKPLSWDQRVRIAQDISRGIEYLHDGVCMILLDMRMWHYYATCISPIIPTRIYNDLRTYEHVQA